MRWLRWNWLDRGLLPLLLALMRFCWLWPWLMLMRQLLTPSHTAPLLAPYWILILPLLSLTVSHLAPVQELPRQKVSAVPQMVSPWWARLGIALLGLLVIGLVVWASEYQGDYRLWEPGWLRGAGESLIHWPTNELPAVGLMVLALVYLWLRGLLDAAQPMAHDDIWGAVLSGVTALVGYLLLTRALGYETVPNLGNLVVLFFAAAMMALAFSSLKITLGLDYALGIGQRRTAKATQASRFWLGSVALVVVGLLGMGVAVGLLVAPEQVARLIALVNGALGLVWHLLGLVLIAISYVIFMIVYYIILLLRPLIERLIALFIAADVTVGQQPEATPTPELVPVAPPVVPDAYRWLALALVVLVILVVFAVVLRKLRGTAEESIDETRESILTTTLLQDQLAKLWKKWFGGLAGTFSPFLSLSGEAETRRIIRQAYQGLLASATQLGQTHLRGQTPIEFGDQLTTQLADPAQAVTTMTEQYNLARYAPEPPSAEAASKVEQAWEQVQQRFPPETDKP